MNIDSFIVYTKTENIYLDITKDVEIIFDTSIDTSISWRKKNKKVIGLMKDE